MSEVYTISGAGLAAAAVAGPVARLQNAIVALGVATGDAALSRLGIDNKAGPATTKAVNYAIKQKYVVMPSFPNPNLTVQHVRRFANGIAAAVEQAVQAAGGTVPPVVIKAHQHVSLSPVGPIQLQPGSEASQPSNNKWIWYVVGGVSILLVLGIVARSSRRPPALQPARA